MNERLKIVRVAGPLLLALAVAGCASTPELDPRQVQQAQIAIEEAKEVNAGRHAAGDLARAEERLATAHEAIEDGDEERARWLLNESVVLAELAEAKALERDSELALAQIRDNMSVLEDRLQSYDRRR
jgi:outer membrane PBP1 activator LpoA protein